jgi:hypothetical protein
VEGTVNVAAETFNVTGTFSGLLFTPVAVI